MEKTFEIADAAIKNILDNIQDEIRTIAEIYDSRDLFGIAYGKFADIIINMVENYK